MASVPGGCYIAFNLMDRPDHNGSIQRVRSHLLAIACVVVISGCRANPPSGVYACQVSLECPPGQRCEAGLCVSGSASQHGSEGQAMVPTSTMPDASATHEEPSEVGGAGGTAMTAGAAAEVLDAGKGGTAADSGSTMAGRSGAAGGGSVTAGVGGAAAGSGGPAAGAGGEMRSCTCTGQNSCCDGCQPRQDSSTCEDDGLACTKDVCRAGKCEHEFVSTSECLIAGKCYASMQENPQNPCQRCDVARTQSAWSGIAGKRCDDKIFCNGTDTCDSLGQCSNHAGDPCVKDADACISCDERMQSCLPDPKATLYDATTNLLWEVVPSQSTIGWQAALDECAALTFCGRSDWRLPTISELRNLFSGCPSTQAGGSCPIADGCLASSCQDANCHGQCASGNIGDHLKPGLIPSNAGCDWSSNPVSDAADKIWCACYRGGDILRGDKATSTSAARCVRTGRLQ